MWQPRKALESTARNMKWAKVWRRCVDILRGYGLKVACEDCAVMIQAVPTELMAVDQKDREDGNECKYKKTFLY